MADPFKAENDDEWSQWFAALRDDQKAKVIKAVTGQSNDFSLRDSATSQNSNITHLPHRFFNESRGLTKLNLYKCTSLAALPAFIGQLQALTELDLEGCRSLAALPESLGQLQALITLSLHFCDSLAALPESFGQLQALTTLNLKYCESLTALPESLGQLQALTELNLYNCTFLAALPDSLGKLQALTRLYLGYCSSLADESKDLARRLVQCNKKIHDGPRRSPERFHMTTYAFAATILFGSSSRYGAGAAAASGQAGEMAGGGGGGGGVSGANDEAEKDGPPRRRQRPAALEGCILSKINELGEDGGALDFKKNMADYCGVSHKEAFEGWAQELKEKFGLKPNGD